MCGCVPLEELPLRPTVTWRSRCALSEVIDERNHSVLGAAGGFIENHDWSAGTPLPSERCRCVGCDRAPCALDSSFQISNSFTSEFARTV